MNRSTSSSSSNNRRRESKSHSRRRKSKPHNLKSTKCYPMDDHVEIDPQDDFQLLSQLLDTSSDYKAKGDVRLDAIDSLTKNLLTLSENEKSAFASEWISENFSSIVNLVLDRFLVKEHRYNGRHKSEDFIPRSQTSAIRLLTIAVISRCHGDLEKFYSKLQPFFLSIFTHNGTYSTTKDSLPEVILGISTCTLLMTTDSLNIIETLHLLWTKILLLTPKNTYIPSNSESTLSKPTKISSFIFEKDLSSDDEVDSDDEREIVPPSGRKSKRLRGGKKQSGIRVISPYIRTRRSDTFLKPKFSSFFQHGHCTYEALLLSSYIQSFTFLSTIFSDHRLIKSYQSFFKLFPRLIAHPEFIVRYSAGELLARFVSAGHSIDSEEIGIPTLLGHQNVWQLVSHLEKSSRFKSYTKRASFKVQKRFYRNLSQQISDPEPIKTPVIIHCPWERSLKYIIDLPNWTAFFRYKILRHWIQFSLNTVLVENSGLQELLKVNIPKSAF